MIAKRIYNGETAEQIGLAEFNYASRKAVLDRFLLEWDGNDFEASYLAWLKTQNEGMPGSTTTIGNVTTPCGACDKKVIEATTAEMIKSATHAFKEYIISGGAKVSEEERTARWGICQACEFLKDSRCIKCGCFMKIKTWLPKEKCRIGKW